VVAQLDLYLASKSPRRHQLLTAAGVRFEVCPPGAEYAGRAHEYAAEAGDPRDLCRARAARKARGASAPDDRAPVLAVDTVVDLDGEELGKASDRAAADALLRRLAGRVHRVHTAHCIVWGAAERAELVSATVRCDELDGDAMRDYLDTGQWQGKAGAYGIQDDGQSFLHLEAGPFDAVVGLHVETVRALVAGVREERDA